MDSAPASSSTPLESEAPTEDTDKAEEVVVPDTDAATAATEAEILADPWHYLKDYFALTSICGDRKKMYQCVLCLPVKKLIKAHASTTSHLKNHITRQHGGSLADFEDTISKGCRRGKRPSGDSNAPNSAKKPQQQSIAAWASGSGYGARQSGVEKRIVDYFVANMLPLQVPYLNFYSGTAVFRIRISLNADPDPGFHLNPILHTWIRSSCHT